MRKVLGRDFFDRPTLAVARDLLGKFLVRKVGDREVAYMIVETEAYDGFNDMASHARQGQTPRNTPMYGKPATIYVYFTYGMHWMLNLVCGKAEYPAAVLIRGLQIPPTEPPKGALRAARPSLTPFGSSVGLKLNGPGKLTKFLQIDKSLNNLPLSKKAGLWVEDRGVVVPPRKIKRTPRIGVDYAGVWAKKPWRFVLLGPKK